MNKGFYKKALTFVGFTLVAVVLFVLWYGFCGGCYATGVEYVLSYNFLFNIIFLPFSPFIVLIFVIAQFTSIMGDIISGTDLGYLIVAIFFIFQIFYSIFIAKKFSKLTLAIICTIGVIIAGTAYFLKPDLGASYLSFIPHEPQTYTAELGEEFKLKIGDEVFIDGEDVSLKITDLEFHDPRPVLPMPEIGTGRPVSKVWYELTVAGEVYTLYMDTHYDIKWTSTNYRTYAKGFIQKDWQNCLDSYVAVDYNSSDSVNACVDRMLQRFGDPKYCEMAASDDVKYNCFEELAYQRREPELCENVPEPHDFCQYLDVTEDIKEITDCSVITGRWESTCYKYYYREGLFKYEGDGNYIEALCTPLGERKQFCISTLRNNFDIFNDDGYPIRHLRYENLTEEEKTLL